MKKMPLRHKAKKNVRYALSFLLSLALAATCCASPVRGAEADEAQDTAQEAVSSFPEEPSAFPQPEPPAAEEEGEEPSQRAGNSEAGPEEASPEGTEPGASVEACTVVFDMGSLGKETVEVEKGQPLTQIPADPSLPIASFLGWFDEDGNQISPLGVIIDRNRQFTARFYRDLGDLLNTSSHTAYISGYENGMFKPEAGISRAEAAKMFFSLLQNQTWQYKGFSDVPSSKWYAPSVNAMAALGAVSGYPDGSFRPTKKITRAEFVKIAVSFDSIVPGSISFSDVPADHWAAPYVASAAEKGWISGFADGTFRPSQEITRAQAVTIINRMLGRIPEVHILAKKDAKNFYDVFTTYWAYGQIEEAATTHTYYRENGEETWTGYERDTSTVEKSHWVQDGRNRYYLDSKTRKFLRGPVKINGVSYLLDPSTGKAVTGFYNNGSWRRYYKNGVIQNDISGLGVVKGPYYIKVYKPSNYLIIFAKDERGVYNTPVKAMRVSCGYGTPTGTYYTPSRYRWLQMIGDTWAQWCTQIQGNYLFHSVPNWTYSNFDLEVEEYNLLGETRSLGCIRLNCRDAKWIYDNCVLGTKVYISGSEKSGPLAKPGGIWIPAWHTWDPTDPTASYRCKQLGCH